MTDTEQSNAISSHNLGYLSPSALQIRLETDNNIEKVETFLSGEKAVTLQNEKTGKIEVKKIKLGPRLMNDDGVRNIVNYVGSIINPHVVQGNYSEDWYREQLEKTHKRLAFILVVNRPSWEIKENAMYSILGFIMEFVKPFLSRLIDNKERESYAATMKSNESSTIQSGSGSIMQKIGIR